jgi:hypothetical protein
MLRFLLAAVLLMPSSALAAGSPSDAVKFFYSPITSETAPENRDHFTDPALTVFQQNDALAAGGDEIGCIDFGLALDAQDYDDAEVARTLKLEENVSGDDASVVATFNLFSGESDAQRKIVWSLKKVGENWKVSDIASDTGDWKLSEFQCKAGE